MTEAKRREEERREECMINDGDKKIKGIMEEEYVSNDGE